jgi:site-specific recombinase XerD
VKPSPRAASIARYQASVSELTQGARAIRTKKAYAADQRDFADFCSELGRAAVPADVETLLIYIASLADSDATTSTIQRRLAGISHAHRVAGVPSPTHDYRVREEMAGIRRTLGVKPNRKAALLTEDVRRIVAPISRGTTIGLRDRALLLLGFATAMRRSELVALDVGDITEYDEGLVVELRRSKTDQVGAGRSILVKRRSDLLCPARAVREWITDAKLSGNNPLFHPVHRSGKVLDGRLSAQGVAIVVKRAVLNAGLDPADYAGHSLRAGHVTSAARAGVDDHVIMQTTGHTNRAMLARYRHEVPRFDEASSAKL